MRKRRDIGPVPFSAPRPVFCPRLDLFAAAAFPGIHKIPGPHGIPLLAHAKKAEQAEVARFIESLG